MKDTNGSNSVSCPVCGVDHFPVWEITHELTWDSTICESCADWYDIEIENELRELRELRETRDES